MARYTAKELITKREEVKGEVDIPLSERLKNYHIGVDDVSLVHVHFSDRFTDAVEAKQIAEQEAKKAGFGENAKTTDRAKNTFLRDGNTDGTSASFSGLGK